MRLCMLVATYPLVTETFVYQPVRWLTERGHDVTVLAKRGAPLPEGDAEPARVVAPRVPTPAREALEWLRAPARATRRFARLRGLRVGRDGALRLAARSLLPEIARADALLAHFGRVGERWLAVAAVARRRYAVYFHGNDATGELRAYPRRYDDLFRSGAGLITNSRFLASRLEAAGAESSRIVVIPYGVADALLAEGPPPLASRTVVTVGRMVEKKGIADSLEAFARARTSLPGWRYEVVGDGPLRSALEGAVRAHGGADAVSFRGFLPHAQTLSAIREAALLVMASRTAASGDTEGTPNCVLEAAALGVPVVATRHGGIPEILPADAEARGFLVPEGDVEGLARAIGRLGADAALRREWGEACRAHVRRRHSADAHVEALIGALERVARVPSL